MSISLFPNVNCGSSHLGNTREGPDTEGHSPGLTIQGEIGHWTESVSSVVMQSELSDPTFTQRGSEGKRHVNPPGCFLTTGAVS